MKKSHFIILNIFHTFIWFFFIASIFFVFYCGLIGKSNYLVWSLAAIVLLEGILLMINKWECPLRRLSLKHDANLPQGADIYVPNFLLFKGHRLFYGAFYFAGIILLAYQVFIK